MRKWKKKFYGSNCMRPTNKEEKISYNELHDDGISCACQDQMQKKCS